jgi:hypothetical protein
MVLDREPDTVPLQRGCQRNRIAGKAATNRGGADAERELAGAGDVARPDPVRVRRDADAVSVERLARCPDVRVGRPARVGWALKRSIVSNPSAATSASSASMRSENVSSGTSASFVSQSPSRAT